MRPECIVLDEPTAMLDPAGRKDVMRTIRMLGERYGITVVLITHYMDEAVRADRVIVIDEGKPILDGTPKQVFSHVDILKKTGLDVPQVTELVHELNRYGFDFKKKFGQNFLIDENVVEKIVREAGVTKDDCVLEIGPGIGTMTQILCENATAVSMALPFPQIFQITGNGEQDERKTDFVYACRQRKPWL